MNRFWFDGTTGYPAGTNVSELWLRTYELIRTVSPATMIGPYRGDICAAIDTVYTNSGPAPNSTDAAACVRGGGGAQFFHPTEMHGITAQMGPDGNTDSIPTYWFWHPWACAGNVSGCPWVGHANASRSEYLRGPPTTRGRAQQTLTPTVLVTALNTPSAQCAPQCSTCTSSRSGTAPY